MRQYRKVFKESSGVDLQALKNQLSVLGLGLKGTVVSLDVMSRPTGLTKGIAINMKGRYYISFYPKMITFSSVDNSNDSVYLYNEVYFVESDEGSLTISYGGTNIKLDY